MKNPFIYNNYKYKVDPLHFGVVFQNGKVNQILKPGEHSLSTPKNLPELSFVQIREFEREYELGIQVFNKYKDKIGFDLSINYRLDDLEKLVLERSKFTRTFDNLKPEDIEAELYDDILLYITNSLNNYDLESLQEHAYRFERLIKDTLDRIFNPSGLEICELKVSNLVFKKYVRNNFVCFITDAQGESRFLNRGFHDIEITEDSLYSLNEIDMRSFNQVITNQEVLTSDNIALRFSYTVSYNIENTEKLAKRFDMLDESFATKLENFAHLQSQISLRNQITTIKSEDLNKDRESIFQKAQSQLDKEFAEVGLKLIDLSIRDISFPKMIQDVFAEQLANEVRAKGTLESARAKVAAARAEKNVAQIMQKNPELKFTLLMETLKKMSEKGRHTFNFDVEKLLKEAR